MPNHATAQPLNVLRFLGKNDIVCYRSGGFLISPEIAAQWASRIRGPGREIDVRYMIPINDAIHPGVKGHGAACELVGNEELNYMVITQSEFLGLYSPNLTTFEDFERGGKEDVVEQFLKDEGVTDYEFMTILRRVTP